MEQIQLPGDGKYLRSFAVSAPLAWNRLPEKIRNLQSLQLFKSSLVSRLTCSAALPDTGKQDTDTDIVTADISRPCNGFAMLRRVINWRIYYYYYKSTRTSLSVQSAATKAVEMPV